ncbi:apolipoprotein N-acyltransferase [Rhodobacteraceae bacterium WD3A24]|nr:apolipoprotein N-acyltransferase [Rhodobacteraceae bacterium WD3A24]
MAGLAVLAGLAVAAGQAPLGAWWVALPGLALLAGLVRGAPGPGRAAWLGLLAGLAHFGAALIWLVEPFLVDPLRHAWLAPFALVAMALGMALFWAVPAGLAARLAPGAPARRLVVFALGMGLSELARGYLFTGFPWARIGHVWIGTPVAQTAALWGAVGLSFLTVLAAALPVIPRGRPSRAGLAALALAGLAAAWGWGAWRLDQPLPEPGRDARIRLIQPNAEQHLKWDPQMARAFFLRHLDLTEAPPEDGAPPPDLVVWSETAVPFLLEDGGRALARAAQAAGRHGARLALGVQRREAGRFYNSLALLDAAGRPEQIYDKHHLVPFGEYVPLADELLGPGYAGFAARQLAGYSPGPGPEVLDFGPRLGRALPLICYEAVFPRNLRTPERPDWVLQVTNDAWFGRLIGPWQHLGQARLRAVEQGLPVLRAANTGVSAVIGPRGELRETLGMGREGAIDTALPPALPPTLYARWGDMPVLLLLLAGLGAGLAWPRLWRVRRH